MIPPLLSMKSPMAFHPISTEGSGRLRLEDYTCILITFVGGCGGPSPFFKRYKHTGADKEQSARWQKLDKLIDQIYMHIWRQVFKFLSTVPKWRYTLRYNIIRLRLFATAEGVEMGARPPMGPTLRSAPMLFRATLVPFSHTPPSLHWGGIFRDRSPIGANGLVHFVPVLLEPVGRIVLATHARASLLVPKDHETSRSRLPWHCFLLSQESQYYSSLKYSETYTPNQIAHLSQNIVSPQVGCRDFALG